MKQLVFLLICAALTKAASAQISLDAKAGINAATITGKDVDGYKTKAGVYFGAAVQIPVTASLSVQPEIFYSTEGARWEEGGKTKLSYLRIPALLKYTSHSGFSAVTGPQFGFLMSAKDEEEKETTDIKEYLKGTDFGWSFGAGYAINPSLSVHARYNLGLTRFYEEEKNSNLQIGIQYKLFTAAKN